ncbi:uncharacterized protein [Apostichopus japonicus]|uniref:uncharacterized protein isoform X2 n=1 Tax=Stichopus japonicus TaxID=307972 RepID=UPI003AB573D1
MTYKILKEKRKSVTSPPRNSERSKEPTADLQDEKQVQKDNYKTIPAPSLLYNSEKSKEPIADIEDDKQVQKDNYKTIPVPSPLYNEPIADIEDEIQIQDNHNNPVSAQSVPCHKNKIQQQEENDREVCAMFPQHDAPIEDIEDEKQTRVNRNNPVSALFIPCSKYTLNRIQQQEENETELCMIIHKELEELIKELERLRQQEDDVIRRFETSGSFPYQLDYSNKPMGFQGRAMQNREAVANRKILLEDLRQLSAGFRKTQDEAFRRFKSKTGGSYHNIKKPVQKRETVTERKLVAPVAFKEERSSCEEKETLNVPVPTGLSKNSACSLQDKSCMEEEVVITTEGGLIEIQDTGVSLEIPPGALEEEQLIKMRIVSDDYHDDLAESFGSNASVVVELLPSNLALLKPAKLTLPHCLVLKLGCEWKAKIYTSHHEKGNQPLWEEDLFASCELHKSFCLIWLQRFCWKKVIVGEEIIDAKFIILFAARRGPFSNSYAYVDVGFCSELPSCQEKKEDVLHHLRIAFYKKGELPLTILFDKDLPSIWTYYPGAENPKQIAFQRVATSNKCLSTFVLKWQGNLEITDCTCYFKAGQGTDLVDLIFPLQKWHLSSSKFVSSSNSDVKIANNKRPPAAEETTETSCSAKTTTVPSDLCSAHLSISRGEPQKTSGPPLDYTVSSTCPECIDVLQYLAQELTDNWQEVGRKLRLTDSILKTIKNDNKDSSKQRCYKMLTKWMQKYGSGATYTVLGKALEEADRKDLQEYVYDNVKI